MKHFVYVVVMLLASSCTVFAPHHERDELFSARSKGGLKNWTYSWRVSETPTGLAVEIVGPNTKDVSLVSGETAQALREKIAALRLSQSDIEFLNAREVPITRKQDGEDAMVFRPFHGYNYDFRIRNSTGFRTVSVYAPDFDLEFHPQFEETARLREVLDLLDLLGQTARKKEGANQSVQRNAGSRPSSSDSPASETPSASAPRG